MSLSRKKVIVRKLNREWVAGYLPPVSFAADGRIELLDLAGKVAELSLSEVKWLCFVRDFNSGETENPERLLRKSFAGRPRTEGLWLRLRLTDGEILEGIAANDLSVRDQEGILVVPPDIRSNTQKVFLPRTSVTAFEVVAVISLPTRRKIAEAPQQEDLFNPLE